MIDSGDRYDGNNLLYVYYGYLMNDFKYKGEWKNRK